MDHDLYEVYIFEVHNARIVVIWAEEQRLGEVGWDVYAYPSVRNRDRGR
jgi:hypothetical protein